MILAMFWKKNLSTLYANIKGSDQLALDCSLIGTFVILYWKSIYMQHTKFQDSSSLSESE